MELWWLLHGAGTVAVAGEHRDSLCFGVLQGRQVSKWPNGDMLCDTALSWVWCVVVFLLVFFGMWAGVGVPGVSAVARLAMVTAPLGTLYSQRPNLCRGSLGTSRQQGPGAHRPLHPRAASQSPS